MASIRSGPSGLPIQIVSNANALARSLQIRRARVEQITRSETVKAGQMLLTRVKFYASGPPGPWAETGLYRSSINLRIDYNGIETVASVGTAAVQARRLEYGFAPGIAPQNGVDVLGRQYHQAPLPHFQPAMDEVVPEYRTNLYTRIWEATQGV